MFSRPSHGGKFCQGSARTLKLCNSQKCPPDSVDFRAAQCAEYNSKHFRGWLYKWKPYTRVEGKFPVPLCRGPMSFYHFNTSCDQHCVFRRADTVGLEGHHNRVPSGDWFDLTHPTAITSYLHLIGRQKPTSQIC